MKKALVLILAFCMLSVFVACAQQPAPAQTAPSEAPKAETAAPAPETSEPEAAPAEETQAPQKKYVIAISTFGLANDYIRVGLDSAIKAADAHGVELRRSVDDNVSKRMASIESFVAQGVDAIIVHEGDASQVLPVLEAAKADGILICAMNSGFHDIMDVSIEPDNSLLGREAAEEMARLMNYTGNIIEIYNDAGAMIKARKDAMHEVLTQYPDMKVTDGFVYAWPDYYPDAIAKMESIFQANPEPGSISGVFATFYGVGLAAAKVIREKELEDYVVVVGIDSDPETFEEMKLPNSPYKATVMSDPEQLGTEAIANLVTLLDGGTIENNHVLIASKLITKDNIPE